MKLGRASWHEDFVGDGNSTHIGEYTNFPELRRLPKKARLPIRKFLQEQLSKFQGERDVSKKKWLFAKQSRSWAMTMKTRMVKKKTLGLKVPEDLTALSSTPPARLAAIGLSNFKLKQEWMFLLWTSTHGQR